jgi:hypothetical protein
MRPARLSGSFLSATSFQYYPLFDRTTLSGFCFLGKIGVLGERDARDIAYQAKPLYSHKVLSLINPGRFILIVGRLT